MLNISAVGFGGSIVYKTVIDEVCIADAERIAPDKGDLLVFPGGVTKSRVSIFTVGAQEIIDLEVSETFDLEVDTKTKQVVSEMVVLAIGLTGIF